MSGHRMSKPAAYFLAMAMLVALAAFSIGRVNYTWKWQGVWEYRVVFAQGWLLTVALSLTSLAVSCIVGFLTALALGSRFRLIEACGRVYVELIRGTPLLVQLLFGWYVVASAVGLGNRYVAGVLILSLFSGAYLAEIFRAGIDAIPRTQRDSARAIGLTPWQSMRLVILPQAARLVVPPVAGQLVSLVKDSSLLSVIGITEFAHSAQEVNSTTFSALECYLPLAAGYLVLTLPLSWLSHWLERRLRFEMG